jgi:hypothetical protein
MKVMVHKNELSAVFLVSTRSMGTRKWCVSRTLLCG